MTYERSSGREPYDKDEAVRAAEDAAGVIDAGWVQNRLTDYEGAYCAIGALMHVDCSWPAYVAVMSKLGELTENTTGLDIVSYNNAETTTQSDVSDLFRRAAKELAQ